MKVAKAYSPGHITGFFQICDSPKSPLFKGSKGAGVSLNRGVLTEIYIKEQEKMTIQISINGTCSDSAIVSEHVIYLFFKKTAIDRKYLLKINHIIDIPIGSGFGSSGAGALSLVIALNSIFNTGLTKIEVAQIAHQAEVEKKTGLGTVIGELFGGIEVRIKSGAPGIGKIMQIPCLKPYKVISLIFGPLSTKSFLENEKTRKKVNHFGRILIEKIIKAPTIENFMKYSNQFALETGLVNNTIKSILSECRKRKIVASMPIFGDGVFAIVSLDKADEVQQLFSNFGRTDNLLVSDIDFQGAKIIDD